VGAWLLCWLQAQYKRASAYWARSNLLRASKLAAPDAGLTVESNRRTYRLLGGFQLRRWLRGWLQSLPRHQLRSWLSSAVELARRLLFP
jgi:hypothetical protein